MPSAANNLAESVDTVPTEIQPQNDVSHSAVPPSASIKHVRKGHKRTSSSVSDSPLQQQNTGNSSTFKPKVITVYEQLFKDEPHQPGYWIEFFLLPVNKSELSRVIRQAAPLSKHEKTVRTLVTAAIANISPQLPDDIIVNALGVLETVLTETLDLSVKAPTTSVIQVLAGIERVTQVFDEFTSNLFALLSHQSLKVVETATATILNIARYSLGTPLNTIFVPRNFFAAFIRIIDKYVNQEVASNAFVAIGVLTALNVYDDDSSSIYLQRINDYVDEAVMSKIIALAQRELSKITVPGSNESVNGISGWFSSWFQPTSGTTKPGEANPSEQMSKLNTVSWRIILPLHLFVLHNSVFAQNFASSPALITLITQSAHVFEHALRSPKYHGRAWLILLMFRRLIDDEFMHLVDPSTATVIKIEVSKLALDTSRRVPLAGILDLMQVVLRSICGHKPPDFQLAEQAAVLINQACGQMVNTKTLWQYNWPSLWKTELGIVKHLTSKKNNECSKTITQLLNTIVGMSLHRDLLEEEDWTFLMYSVVQNSNLLNDTAETFPELSQARAVTTAKAMTSQYELKQDTPDLSSVLKQGRLSVGRISCLVGEKHRPFSALNEPVIQRIMKLLVK